ncbi:MAG: hypothetical protein P4M05_28370 [Bradyrhizobium sp.]|nr:hypothetical protein [Bradyrhizobium sp.]
MPKIHVAKDFVLKHDDGTKTPFKKGEHEVEDHVANHWFVKANLVGAKPNPGAGTPAFLRAATEERSRLEAEHHRLESERDAAVTASVREKMEAELADRIKIALEQQAVAAVNAVDAEVAKRVAVATAQIEATVQARIDKAVEEALLAHIEAEAKSGELKAAEEAKAADAAKAAEKAPEKGVKAK